MSLGHKLTHSLQNSCEFAFIASLGLIFVKIISVLFFWQWLVRRYPQPFFCYYRYCFKQFYYKLSFAFSSFCLCILFCAVKLFFSHFVATAVVITNCCVYPLWFCSFVCTFFWLPFSFWCQAFVLFVFVLFVSECVRVVRCTMKTVVFFFYCVYVFVFVWKFPCSCTKNN